MDTKLIKVETLQDIADAIKEKEATDDLIPVDEYAERIRGIEGGKVRLQAKIATPTAEGTVVEPDKGYGGLSVVTIEGDENLKAENIAEGVSIFGVTGTHAGGGDLDALIDGTITEVNSGATKLREYALYKQPSLVSANFPNLKEVPLYCFGSCALLANIVLPSVTKINNYAFSACNALVNVTLPSVTFLGQSSFSGCTALMAVDFPNVTSIANQVFSSCKALKSAKFPQAKSTGEATFRYCESLENIDFPSATLIDGYAFSGCNKIVNVNVTGEENNLNAPNVTTMYSNAFRECYGLTNVHFPNLTMVQSETFYHCQVLTNVDLPKVKSIGAKAFMFCYSLKSVILRSETVCTLSNTSALQGCYHILGTVDTTYNPNGDKDGYIYVPANLVDSYKTATNWSTYASQIRAIDEGGGEVEGNWLFQNEQITSEGRLDLSAPVDGVSYTAFVDGEEIATSTCEGGVLNFNTEDYRIYLICDASTGLGWHFHPVDSQVQSGSVSIRINE